MYITKISLIVGRYVFCPHIRNWKFPMMMQKLLLLYSFFMKDNSFLIGFILCASMKLIKFFKGLWVNRTLIIILASKFESSDSLKIFKFHHTPSLSYLMKFHMKYDMPGSLRRVCNCLRHLTASSLKVLHILLHSTFLFY